MNNNDAKELHEKVIKNLEMYTNSGIDSALTSSKLHSVAHDIYRRTSESNNAFPQESLANNVYKELYELVFINVRQGGKKRKKQELKGLRVILKKGMDLKKPFYFFFKKCSIN